MSQINREPYLLHPDFRRLLMLGLRQAHRAGLKAYLFEGYRSFKRQAVLYNQGRTTEGRIVTWVRPGLSYHNYSIAGDIVFDGSEKPGIQWSWEGDYAEIYKDDYAKLAEILKSVGLHWLGDTGIERAHFQLKTSIKIAEMKEIYEAEGLLALWSILHKEQRGSKR
jgi:peptidoglycan L-alanyl-D-glutamate endopeptidase CwlK